MTTRLATNEIARQLNERYPGAVSEVAENTILVNTQSLIDVMTFLKNTPGLDFDYLTTITGVDYYQQFEVVYQLVSIQHNHSLIVKARCDREGAKLPSVIRVGHNADYHEREIYDLLGITFEGHPNMKRIVLWPEFKGYPLRRDYLQ